MSFQSTIIQVIWETLITTISELAKSFAYFILIIWGVRKIVKEVPSWLNIYHKQQMEKYRIEKAIETREKVK